MSLTLLIVLFPIFVIPWLTKIFLPRKVTWIEIGSSFAVGIILTLVVYATGMYSQTDDIEILNGQVISKYHEKVPCRHSYQCHCHMVTSGYGKHSTTTEECDTCYEHPYDVDWVVHSNVRDFDINTLDSQGLREPPRWTIVKPGDPVSAKHHFTNYVKAVPDSLFHKNLTHRFDNMIPVYPAGIYDYYKLNRAITEGVPVPDIAEWDNDISDILRTLGPEKQANVIVIFVNTSDESYIHSLEGKWVGGKKNDIIVILGVTHYPKIDWVGISSWTDAALFKVELHDDISAIGTVDRTKIIKVIAADTQKMFKRKEMKDFEYLKTQIQPPTWVLVLAVILGLIASVITTIVVRKNGY